MDASGTFFETNDDYLIELQKNAVNDGELIYVEDEEFEHEGVKATYTGYKRLDDGLK